MRNIGWFGLAAAALFAAACATAPVTVPDGLSPSELIQAAQDASDLNRYDHAVQYYQTILDRFPDDRPSVCAAEYEIAFIQYKRKEYAAAQAGFQRLLALYEQADAALLPAQYRILGEKILAKIELEAK